MSQERKEQIEKSEVVILGREITRREFLIGLVGGGVALISRCQPQEGQPQETPPPATSTPPEILPTPQPSPTAEVRDIAIAIDRLAERGVGGGNVVEVEYQGMVQNVVEFADVNKRKYYALSTYCSKLADGTEAERYFEEEHVLFPEEGLAFLLLRQPPSEFPEAKPFYNCLTSPEFHNGKLIWVESGEIKQSEDPFFHLEKEEENLDFTPDIGGFWTLTTNGEKARFIDVFEPESIRLGEITKEWVEACLEKEGTGWEEIREKNEEVMEIGHVLDGRWVHRGFIIRKIPQRIWGPEGQVLRADYDAQNPSMTIPYVDGDNHSHYWLSLVYGLKMKPQKRRDQIEKEGYWPIIRPKPKNQGGMEVILTNESGQKEPVRGQGPLLKVHYDYVDIAEVKVDQLTWITGEASLYSVNGSYLNAMNEDITNQMYKHLVEAQVMPGSVLERMFDLLDGHELENQRMWDNGLTENQLDAEGFEIARQIYKKWRQRSFPPVILKHEDGSTENHSRQYLDVPGVLIGNFTPEQETEVKEVTRMIQELFQRVFERGEIAYLAGDLKYALSVTTLTTEKTLRGLCDCPFIHPLGYSTAPEYHFRGCGLFPGLFAYGKDGTEGDFVRRAIMASSILHEGAHIRQDLKPGSGVGFPRSNMVTARSEQAFLDCYYHELTEYQKDWLRMLIEFDISLTSWSG